jgi:hypothetical protein
MAVALTANGGGHSPHVTHAALTAPGCGGRPLLSMPKCSVLQGLHVGLRCAGLPCRETWSSCFGWVHSMHTQGRSIRGAGRWLWTGGVGCAALLVTCHLGPSIRWGTWDVVLLGCSFLKRKRGRAGRLARASSACRVTVRSLCAPRRRPPTPGCCRMLPQWHTKAPQDSHVDADPGRRYSRQHSAAQPRAIIVFFPTCAGDKHIFLDEAKNWSRAPAPHGQL